MTVMRNQSNIKNVIDKINKFSFIQSKPDSTDNVAIRSPFPNAL